MKVINGQAFQDVRRKPIRSSGLDLMTEEFPEELGSGGHGWFSEARSAMTPRPAMKSWP